MIEFLNPDADVGIENTPYDLSVKVEGDNATTIGLLANGFPDSVPWLFRACCAPAVLVHDANSHRFPVNVWQTNDGAYAGSHAF